MSDNCFVSKPERLKGQILRFSSSSVKITELVSEASERIFRARLKKLGTNQCYTYWRDAAGRSRRGRLAKKRQRQNVQRPFDTSGGFKSN